MTPSDPRSARNTNPRNEPGILARMALSLTDWTERWVPDAFVFALVATIIVVVAGFLFTPSTPAQVIDAWGRGFWELIPFTLQMALVIITGHVLATSHPVGRVIGALAAWPRTPRNAVALVAFFAMASAWFNWGFSLIFSAVLAKEIARRVEGLDYRALAAASFLGLGSIWAQGLSGSAALQMATPGALQPQIRDIVANNGMVAGGIIPLRHTIFLWQSVVSVIVEIAVVTAVMWLVTPPPGRGKTARDLGIELGKAEIEPAADVARPTPGQWLEHSPILNWLIVLIGGTYLVRYFMQASEPLSAINLNIVNLTFLLLGFLLHKTPARLMHAVQSATPAVWGVILQFPFYAGIAGIIISTHLSQQIAHAFVGISNAQTFPPIVAIYSAVLGVFVPSGGSKWVVEAPYVMAAAHELKVHLGWVVAAYDLGEALANLVQPFWMLPILGLFGLRARDVMGYTFVVFLVLVPVVLLLVTILGATLPHPL
ncbi:MAG: short-chain fatty acid transporter [Chthoniobacterales bacterium]|nr:short-chain fatty acid transporter [Chthoniobacterales bacterium]